MSTIAADDLAQFPGTPFGRWVSGAFTIGLLLAAALAVYLEPFFLLDRVRGAERASNEHELRALVDPGLIGPDLAAYLDASRPGPGRAIERRYETPSRFLVTVRRDVAGLTAPASPPPELTLVLERRGMAWWLVDVAGPEPWELESLFGGPTGINRGEPRSDQPADMRGRPRSDTSPRLLVGVRPRRRGTS